MIPAGEAIRTVNDNRADAIVVATMTPTRYWKRVSGRPELDLPIYGGMGKASSVGLGLALARPDTRVLVLDGDGSLLMNLGTLVTIAGQAPPNLVHFVFEDGVYFTTGGQPVPGAGTFDLAAIAKNAGFRESFEFDDLEEFATDLPGLLERRGPTFVCLKVFHADDTPGLDMQSTKDAVKRVREKLEDGPASESVH